MRRPRARSIARQPQPGAARLALAFVVLVAFCFQGYVAQTHIHLPSAAVHSVSGKSKPAGDRFPSSGDPANCPICHEIAHAGQYVIPVAVALLQPALLGSIGRMAVALPALPPGTSHDWKSRAPPAH